MTAPTEPTAATAAPRPPREEAQFATDEIQEPAPGILRLQLPIRMPGLGHVNCYAMEDAKGWTVVDPGMPGPKPFKAMESRFAAVLTRPLRLPNRRRPPIRPSPARPAC